MRRGCVLRWVRAGVALMVSGSSNTQRRVEVVRLALSFHLCDKRNNETKPTMAWGRREHQLEREQKSRRMDLGVQKSLSLSHAELAAKQRGKQQRPPQRWERLRRVGGACDERGAAGKGKEPTTHASTAAPPTPKGEKASGSSSSAVRKWRHRLARPAQDGGSSFGRAIGGCFLTHPPHLSHLHPWSFLLFFPLSSPFASLLLRCSHCSAPGTEPNLKPDMQPRSAAREKGLDVEEKRQVPLIECRPLSAAGGGWMQPQIANHASARWPPRKHLKQNSQS